MAQSKWTIADIKSAVAAYCLQAKQADPSWTPGAESISGLMEKIMKTVVIDGEFIDKLPELDGEELPFGEAIEEYFVNLVPVQDYDDYEADDSDACNDALKPYRPSFGTVFYDEKLGRKKFATTVDEYKYQDALNGEGDLSTLVALVMKRLYDSYAMWKYNTKKKLIGNMIQKAAAVEDASHNKLLVAELAKPVDTETGEAFIKEVKNLVEIAGFVSENTSLSKTTIGAEDGLKLYIKKGIMSSLEVDTLAGAFNAEKLALPCEIKVVEDFGAIGAGDVDAYAVLMDPRGIKLHRNYEAVREQENASGDYRNFFLHTEHTGFISPYTFVKVFVEPGE